MLEGMFNDTKIVEKALDASWLRNEAIAQNIANVDTPGYKRKTVKFEEFLNDAMDKSKLRHRKMNASSVDDIKIQVTEDNSALSTRLDGNNVDIENEMAQMAKNTIQYNTLIQRLNGKYKTLLSVINEGRR